MLNLTSRSYDKIKSDLINSLNTVNPNWTDYSESDLGITLLEVMAYLTDLNNFYIDKMVHESYVETALQRGSLLKLAKMIGYVPINFEPAIVTLKFYTTEPYDYDILIPKGTICNSVISNTTINFYTLQDVVISANNTEAEVIARQGTERTFTTNTFGIRKYRLPGRKVSSNKDLISVVIGTEPWTYVESFKDSLRDNKQFSIEVDELYNVYIVFGDGFYGALPSRVPMVVTYNENDGKMGYIQPRKISNIGSTIYGQTSLSDIRVINQKASVGASDPFNEELLRYIIKTLYRMQDRAVTKDDFKAIIMSHSGVKQCIVYDVKDDRRIGYYKIQIYILADGDLELITNQLAVTMNRYKYVTLQWEIKEVEVEDVSIAIQVRSYPLIDFLGVKNTLTNLLVNYFTPAQFGEQGLLIGQNINYSDLVSLADNVSGVDYINLTLNGGTTNLEVDKNKIARLAELTIIQI